jgi:hypothetical protein
MREKMAHMLKLGTLVGLVLLSLNSEAQNLNQEIDQKIEEFSMLSEEQQQNILRQELTPFAWLTYQQSHLLLDNKESLYPSFAIYQNLQKIFLQFSGSAHFLGGYVCRDSVQFFSLLAAVSTGVTSFLYDKKYEEKKPETEKNKKKSLTLAAITVVFMMPTLGCR